ncbi:hypothetical protein TRIUR3_31688 [Triticum urartu]|uniref:Uncharacterized protein n=1 Tax=Triticum urartu TaxID=4572 RepID=M8AHC1_TRIUA|nr:hypothetical protein TRIUR3_31688 [Triticum urartu]
MKVTAEDCETFRVCNRRRLIDRAEMGRPSSTAKLGEGEGGWGLLLPAALWLPALLVVLILAINVACFVDRRVVRFDPYWIHRVGGSSCGLMATLLLLGFVLKCKG